jgi:serine/threonine-protein kinase
LVYGDVQPRSIHLQGETVRFADVGLVGLSDAECRLVQTDGLTRQVFYLCPVQAASGSRNVRGDLYGLGCILFHMLAGRPPFLGGTYAEVLARHQRDPLPALSGPLGLPERTDRILADMLHKDPFFRLDDLASAEAQLATLAEELG